MRKRDLMRALSSPDFCLPSNQKPSERAVFLHSEEMESCCSILAKLMNASLNQDPAGRHRNSLPLPDVDLPMVF
ncbi:hypothetical protein LMG23994_05202 [Cupriavidus pinatubonensis]|uniref:Uncharacterized protein n=1 Tax=Cupriavidus pinatubonensis TaxID=248026 RepID=A0ABM8XTH1_9BURK|nr:hypothetical protein LMG23994_05202 [Cupriavidus pinatubonensis]